MSGEYWKTCLAVSAVGLAVTIAPAQATMPTLPTLPKARTPALCRIWASNATRQDGDVAEMWGILESGESSLNVALDRLAAYCSHGTTPDIVGWGSSAGFSDLYCTKHPFTPICERYFRERSKEQDHSNAVYPTCTLFEKEETVNIKGFVVEQYIAPGESERQKWFPYLRLDEPLCEKGNTARFRIIWIKSVDRGFLGRHVEIRAQIAYAEMSEISGGSSWQAEIRSIKLDPSFFELDATP